MIDKDLVWQQLFSELTRLIKVAQAAAQRAHDTATDDQNVAENKYDTLGLEAAYLAHGQQERVQQCQSDLADYQLLAQRYIHQDKIQLGTLVALIDEDEQCRYFLLGNGGGGVKLNISDVEVLVITPDAPLGEALLGKQLEDEVNLNIGGNLVNYEITAFN